MPILKPSSCSDCPLYKTSQYITPDSLRDSPVLILAQAPGEHEEQGEALLERRGKHEITQSVRPQPLIGPTGKWLQDEFWPLTKLPYSEASKANVLKCRPYNSNALPSLQNNISINGITPKVLREAVDYCTKTYLRIPPSTKYILAMGALSLYSLVGDIRRITEDYETGEEKIERESITDWRGWVLGKDALYSEGELYLGQRTLGIDNYYSPNPSGVKIFPTIHIASLFQSQKYYNATLHDFRRFGKLVRGEWPLALPEIKINTIPSSIPTTIGFDTEYDPRDNNRLEMWSMADVAGNIYVVDAAVSRQLEAVPEELTLVTQNGIVDFPHFIPLIRDTDLRRINMEDCMLAHAVLHTGELNSLDYILSKVGMYNRHKHLRGTHDINTKYLYAGLDADTTLNHAWRGLLQDFSKDPLSWKEYKLRRQPLLRVIHNFNRRGIKIWEERVDYIGDILDKKIASLIEEAKLLTGNENFNLSSPPQVGAALYEGDYFTDSVTRKERAKVTRRVEKAKDITPRKKALRSRENPAQVLIDQLKLKLGIEE